MWGVANSLNDVLIPQFRKAFQLDDFASSLVQSAFYFGYFCFAIPASLFMRRFGYRAAVLMGLGLYGCGRTAVPAGGAGQPVLRVPHRVVRDRQRPRVPRDLGESAHRRHGPGRQRRSAAEFRADLQSHRHDVGLVCRRHADLLRRALHARAAAGADAGGLRRVPRRRARLGQTTLRLHRRHGDRLGACWSPSRNFRRSIAAAARWRNRRRLRGPREISALLARRARAVRVRRRAGGRVELPDPLHAAQFSGHRSRRTRCAGCRFPSAYSSPAASSARC